MLKNRRVLLRKAQHPLLMASATIPLAIWLVLYSHPSALPVLPLQVLLFELLCLGCFLLPGRWRLPGAAGAVALQLGFAALVLPVRVAPLLLLVPMGYGVLLFLALPIAGWLPNREPSPVWIGVGVSAHVLLQLLAGAAARSGVDLYQPADPLRLCSLLLFLALTVLSLNRSSLSMAAQARVQVPVQMRRKNAALTLGLLAVALLVAALPAIGVALERLWRFLMQGIGSVVAFFTALLSPANGTGAGGGDGGGGSMLLPTADAGGVSPFHQLLEKLIAAITVAALAVAAVLLVRFLWRQLRRLLQFLRQRLSRFTGVASRDYEDEVTDTREDGEYRPTGLMKRLRAQLTRADESRMTPAQRVRYRYLRLRMKHNDWKPAHTARETLPPEAARLYERARYGGQPLSAEEAEQFKEGTRSL